jgi:hypothetical protein
MLSRASVVVADSARTSLPSRTVGAPRDSALSAGRVCVADVAVAGLVDHAVTSEHRVAKAGEGADGHAGEWLDKVKAVVDNGRVDAVVGPRRCDWYLAPLLGEGLFGPLFGQGVGKQVADADALELLRSVSVWSRRPARVSGPNESIVRVVPMVGTNWAVIAWMLPVNTRAVPPASRATSTVMVSPTAGRTAGSSRTMRASDAWMASQKVVRPRWINTESSVSDVWLTAADGDGDLTGPAHQRFPPEKVLADRWPVELMRSISRNTW